MLTTIKDNEGNIICACEWRKVNDKCEFDIKGNNIWIHTVEISKPYWNSGILYDLIEKVINEMPYFKYASFRREKYNGRVKGYKRDSWLKLIKEKKYAYSA